MLELFWRQPKYLLHGLDQFAAARMKQKAVEIRKTKTVAVEKILQCRRQFLAHQRRQFGTQYDAETVVFDVPSHDVLGLAPAPFTACEDARPAAAAVSRIAQQYPRRAVAEQSAGDKHRRAAIVDAQAQAAKIDGQEQHMRAVFGVRHAARPGETGHARPAAQAEH